MNRLFMFVVIYMSGVLFKKATAVWLVENTSLTFEQIAEFCSLSLMEIRTIADGEYEIMRGINPIENGQLTNAEIERCQSNATARLKIKDYVQENSKMKKTNIPHNEILSAVLWMVKNHSKLSAENISNITGASVDMIESIKQRGRRSIPQVIAKSPVSIGLCTKEEFDVYLNKLKC